jgi:LPS-assembly protein
LKIDPRATQRLAACAWILSLTISSVAAQTAPQEPAAKEPAQRRSSLENLPDCDQSKLEPIGDDLTPPETDHLRYTGDVECTLPEGVKVAADVIDVYLSADTERIVAVGNVAFDGPEAHVAAARLEYDTRSGKGTFHQAHGFLALGADASGSEFMTRDTDVYFEGERLERIGPRRYTVTKGRWTTCEQPTPRWQMSSTSMLINLENYVIARNTVLRVKNVPLFYVPWIYYPIESDDRSTGFLMPSYGTSTYRGQAISNAFFWVLGRSHDATFMHDWFTKAGQGAGAEYRYVTGPQSSGTIRPYFFERSATETTQDGVTTVTPGATSFELTGTAVQTFARNIIGRARFDYFSDVLSQQLLHQNFYEASRRNRLLEGGLTASFGPLSTSVLYQRNDVINGVADTFLYGSTPRANASLAPQRLFGGPIYASVNAEYAYQPYRRFLNGDLLQDDSFGRVDVAPSVRVPLSRLSFLSINQSASYRYTYYTRQAGTTTQTDSNAYVRQYGSARTEMVGPVFTRIFDLPENAFAERLKHVIEPAITVDVTSPISDFRSTPILSDVSDFVVGGNAKVTYRITNRLFSRGWTVNKVRGSTREIVTVDLQQSFYTAPESSRYDSTYVSAQGSGANRDLSPVALGVRVSPAPAVDVETRAEFDTSRGHGMMVLTTGASLNGARSGVTLNYSRQRLNPSQDANSFVTATTRWRLFNDRVSTNYSLSWDVARSYIVSQRIVSSYMAQCCGVQAEYQQFNFPTGFGLPITSDRRFNLAFVLAGLGTFSNFFGAFGG